MREVSREMQDLNGRHIDACQKSIETIYVNTEEKWIEATLRMAFVEGREVVCSFWEPSWMAIR